MAIQITEEKNCTGCTACQAVCPVSCIAMQEDAKGFLYPSVDYDLCIECGLCERTCPLLKPISQENKVLSVYAAKAKDKEILRKSSSGGMFIPLSDAMLKEGGVVYGAAFNPLMEVSHCRCTTFTERDRCVGSKYVQSNLVGVLDQVKKDLNEKRPVLFTGTPCQVAGLLSFLAQTNTDTSLLVCCDVFCFGVPSPKVWKDYLKQVEREKGEPVKEAFFRDKTYGWADFSLRLETEHTASVEKNNENAYMQLFLQRLINRPSCFDCHFSNLDRKGDLSIGDYWGIEHSMPDFFESNGVSVTLVNSQKGKAWMEKIKDTLSLRESNLNDCMQPVLSGPTAQPIGYESFWKQYARSGFGEERT
ncbi:Coenzyme F420 hydrogenase/dehydrogenase, beta subunit C-terminal domain [Sphaerochaeta pleomorpha]|nr:Coenzyme F420 hydrogenase/dehydrogenase, beta subunit C-terminal domain [Sphaerochaeta pleomorpha]